MPKLTIDIISHSVGDHQAYLSEYEGGTWITGEKGITLTGTFASEREEFAKLEQAVAKAKAKALRIVAAPQDGVAAAQRVFAKVLEKADPAAPSTNG